MPVISSMMAWRCIVCCAYCIRNNVVFLWRSLWRRHNVDLSRIEESAGTPVVLWLSTGRKNGLNVKNTQLIVDRFGWVVEQCHPVYEYSIEMLDDVYKKNGFSRRRKLMLTSTAIIQSVLCGRLPWGGVDRFWMVPEYRTSIRKCHPVCSIEI